jgi:hypothetical protein
MTPGSFLRDELVRHGGCLASGHLGVRHEDVAEVKI